MLVYSIRPFLNKLKPFSPNLIKREREDRQKEGAERKERLIKFFEARSI